MLLFCILLHRLDSYKVTLVLDESSLVAEAPGFSVEQQGTMCATNFHNHLLYSFSRPFNALPTSRFVLSPENGEPLQEFWYRSFFVKFESTGSLVVSCVPTTVTLQDTTVGACSQCQPQCLNRQCGSNQCGFYCGVCSDDGTALCDAGNGRCALPSVLSEAVPR